MKPLYLSLLAVFLTLSTPAAASVRGYNSSGTLLGTYTDIQAGNGISASQVSGKYKFAVTSGDGTTALAGFLQSLYSTSGDLSVAQCGKTVTSDNSMGTTALFNLPTITSSNVGCRITFVVGTNNGYRMNINPADANKILSLTNSAGDAVTADDLGDSLTLQAIAPGWIPVGTAYGTWTDAN